MPRRSVVDRRWRAGPLGISRRASRIGPPFFTRSEARYTDLVESASDAIFTVDASGNFTSVNRALEQLKEAEYWIYGLDERGTDDYDKVQYASPSVLARI